MQTTYYNKISKGYNKLHGEEQKKKLDIIKQYFKDHNLKIKKSTKLLDVGCGSGISSDFDCRVIGIDPSIELTKIATSTYNYKKTKQTKPQKRFIRASAEQIPFPNKYFDIVISLTAVHNFSDIEKGLCEIKRVGKERFVISVLKRSSKAKMIAKLITKHFNIIQKIGEDKDIIYFLA